MIKIRKAAERGHADHGWLKSWHTFSFADYFDPENMGFRSLRVINEDYVAADQGFGTHPHRDMEIVTYVLEGALAHRDSMGNGTTIRPGEVQRMSAGTGVTHSELNPSKNETVHLLQIWIKPEKPGLTPSYEQKSYSTEEKSGKFRLVASRDGRDGSVTIHQDASIYASVLRQGQSVSWENKPERHAWIQIARGNAKLSSIEGEYSLAAGDGVAISGGSPVSLTTDSDVEILLFDLS